MALGSGEGQAALVAETENRYVRPRSIVNRFDYILPRKSDPAPVAAEPGGISPLSLLQPGVPTSRAEKERAKCATDFVRTAADVKAPPTPLPARSSWPHSRAVSPLQLTTARSRSSMLSERIARNG